MSFKNYESDQKFLFGKKERDIQSVVNYACLFRLNLKMNNIISVVKIRRVTIKKKNNKKKCKTSSQ